MHRKAEELVAAVRADRGVDAALAALYREAPVEERSVLLFSLGDLPARQRSCERRADVLAGLRC